MSFYTSIFINLSFLMKIYILIPYSKTEYFSEHFGVKESNFGWIVIKVIFYYLNFKVIMSGM